MVLGSGKGAVGGPTAIACPAATGEGTAAEGLATGETATGEAATGEAGEVLFATVKAVGGAAFGCAAVGALGVCTQLARANVIMRAPQRSARLTTRRSPPVPTSFPTSRQY